MAIKFDYSRAGLRMSWRRVACATAVLAAGALGVAAAQYPGQVSTDKKKQPELRSIAVVEWIGTEGKPTRSRIVPVAVLDQGDLQDGGVYLARPMPLALDSGVEYELEQNGKKIGLYDVHFAGEQDGSWVGFGQWKPLVKPAPKPPPRMAHIDEQDIPSDEPVLHRKHHPDDASGGNGGSSGSGSAPAPDPDRPTLHRSDSSEDTGSTTSSGSSSGNSGSSGSTTSANSGDNSNGPTLHRRDASDSNPDSSGSSNSGSASGTDTSGGSSTGSTDPDRPTLHRQTSDDTASANSTDPDRPRLTQKQTSNDEAYVSSVSSSVDPNRPRLRRGMSNEDAAEVAPSAPSLKGVPSEMQQAVAISDAQPIPEHIWRYSWANPDDEKKMQAALEDIARKDLAPPQPAAPAPVRTSTTPAHRKSQSAPPPPPPLPLQDEQFRVFELAYGSGATLVLSAHTDGAGEAEKYITLIAQPDLYGNPLVLLKNVTDAAHLDDTPRMHLVDAVDAMADNRGELLFELRGATQRQFALYRVLRGQVQKLFVSGSSPIGGE